MKIVKCRFPRLSLQFQLSPNQTQPPPPPLKKKALLIGIQDIRQDTAEIIQENGERLAEDVKSVPKRKNKKKQKDRDKEGAPKAEELKGPHRDVMQMKQLLIGALYHAILFPPAS